MSKSKGSMGFLKSSINKDARDFLKAFSATIKLESTTMNMNPHPKIKTFLLWIVVKYHKIPK
jgi:hypothetical protein